MRVLFLIGLVLLPFPALAFVPDQAASSTVVVSPSKPGELHMSIHASPNLLRASAVQTASRHILPAYHGRPIPTYRANQGPWWAGWEAPTGPGRAWPNAYYGVQPIPSFGR